MSDNIGVRVRRLRRDLGWSRAQLADALLKTGREEGYLPPAADSVRIMVARWEIGVRTPDDYHKRLLYVALQIPPDTFDA